MCNLLTLMARLSSLYVKRMLLLWPVKTWAWGSCTRCLSSVTSFTTILHISPVIQSPAYCRNSLSRTTTRMTRPMKMTMTTTTTIPTTTMTTMTTMTTTMTTTKRWAGHPKISPTKNWQTARNATLPLLSRDSSSSPLSIRMW